MSCREPFAVFNCTWPLFVVVSGIEPMTPVSG